MLSRFISSVISLSVGIGSAAMPAKAQSCALFPGASFPLSCFPLSVAVGDLDGGDNDLDLAVANFGSNTISVLLNNGDGTYAAHVQYSVGSFPLSVAVGDLNGDNDLDLAVANRISNTVSVLLNNGNGTFADHVQYGAGPDPTSVAVGDLDGDNDLDLAVAHYGFNNSTVSVLLNNGNGTFAPPANYGWGIFLSSVAVGDLDGDNDLDLAVASAFGGHYACAGSLSNADVVPCVGNNYINLDDIMAVMRAFGGANLCP